jgi:site-specific DNA-methyltransferase (cytosine-N4-specific)
MKVSFYWHSYRYLPYEQALASREISTLLGQEPIYQGEGLSIESANGWKTYAQRATYFREAVADDGSRVVPLQTLLETSTKRNTTPPLFDVEISQNAPNADVFPHSPHIDVQQTLHRQSTRYSAHGLHEYRGKFNPQIVRAIGNILGLQPGDWVLDPFCGSGTTLLESAHAGWNALSVDINPLGVQIARAKIAAMRVPLADLQKHIKTVFQRLHERFSNISFEHAFTEDQMRSIGGEDWQTCLPSFDYLCSWFTKSVLVQLAAILYEVNQVPSEEVQLILRVVLSDILRDVSLQDSGDLRIRRRKSPPENAPAVPVYLADLKSKIETILNARQYIPTLTTIQDALLGDSRYCSSVVRSYAEVSRSFQFNGAITSPPYATALPYIDTQRLSLVLLGLINPDEIRTTERSLTGNREITTQERLKLEKAIEINEDHLPDECIRLCRELKKSVDKDNDGFRRQNVPALIYKYLVDMALMFKNTHALLQANAPFALVVGKNQTCLGGRTFIIDTPHLLVLLAQHNGFELQEIFALNTYQRFDVHQDNSIRSENLIILRKIDHANRGHPTN